MYKVPQRATEERMVSIDADFEFLATTVPAILVLGGILMLLLNFTPLGVPSSWGWALIIIGVLLYVGEMFAERGR